MDILWNLEAEEAVLGSLLIDGETIREVMDIIKPSDFFRETNQWIYDACLKLQQRNAPIDTLTVATEVGTKVDNIDATVCHLIAVVPTSLHAKYYAEIVAGESRKRRLQSVVANLDYNNIDEAIKGLGQSLNTIGRAVNDVSYIMSGEMAMEWLTRQDTALIPSGFKGIDGKTGGLGRGEQMVIGAYSGNGKTSFMADMLIRMANLGLKTLFCSCEMKQHQIASKVIINLSGISALAVRKNEFSDDESGRIQQAINDMNDLNFAYMRYAGNATTDKIRKCVEMVKRDIGLDVVFVDFLQTLQDKYSDSERERTGYMSRQLAAVAKEFDVVTVVASQFRRAAMEKADPASDPVTEAERVRSDMKSAPHLWDLRETGAIENDADLVVLLHRPRTTTGALSNRTYAIVAKNRHVGITGFFPLDYINNIYREI